MRVLIWADSASGHHEAYVSQLLYGAPAHIEIVAPSWAAHPARSCAADVVTYESGVTLRQVLRAYPLDAVVVVDGHEYLPKLAVQSLPGLVCAIDIRAADVPRPFGDLRWIEGLKWAAARTLKEVAVRRNRSFFFVLDGRALGRGSTRLRSRTFRLRDVVVTMAPVVRRQGGSPFTALLLGSLERRKGVDVALEAAWLLRDTIEIHIIIAGKPRSDYVHELGDVLEAYRKRGVDVESILGRVPDAHLPHLLGRSDVLLLPYLRHKGGTGLLPLAEQAHLPAIVSDGGWLGCIADRAGAITIPMGNAGALAEALLTVAKGGAAPVCASKVDYATPGRFGSEVWSCLTETYLRGT